MAFLRKIFDLSEDNPELVSAQYNAFVRQVPILYFILVTNTLMVCRSFYGIAPPYLSLYIPALLCIFCVVRFFFWLVHAQKPVSAEIAFARLKQLHVIAIALSVFFTAWGLALYPYGDAYSQGQVSFFIGLTVVGCISCLMQVRSAALLVALIVNVPFVLFFLLEDNVSLRAMAINVALVCFAMMVMLFGYARDFANLVESRKSLLLKQKETQRLSDENLLLAHLDSLTDLPNRRRFFAALEEAFDYAKESGRRLVIGVIDLDGFKPVNDTYGHLVGDKLLVEVSRRLESRVGGDGGLYRLGGDEFALLFEDTISAEDIADYGRSLIDSLRAPFFVGPLDIRIGCSIGFVSCDDADSPGELYERADYALFHAKRHQRGDAILFNAAHEAQIRAASEVEIALQRAELDAELRLVFQPIVDARSGRPVALEALARWRSPTLGDVPPAIFIPVAERNGMIRALTKVLLRKALTAMNDWPAGLRLSFNLSVHDIVAPEGMLALIDILSKSGIDPRRIDFEITETAVANDYEKACEAIHKLRELGARVSLDDFGAGYSSLSHVRELPLDKVKIDRSFIVDIATNKISHDIVKALQSLCKDIGVVCVVEGVEEEAQVKTLAEIGCNLIQGYYFSRPIAEEDLGSYFASVGLDETQCAALVATG